MGVYTYNKESDELRQVAGRQPSDIYRYSDSLTLEEIEASSDLTRKIPNAGTVKEISGNLEQLGNVTSNLSNFSMRFLARLESDATETSKTYKSIDLICPNSKNFFILGFSNINERMSAYIIRVNGTNLYSLPIANANANNQITIENVGSNIVRIKANSTATTYVNAMVFDSETGGWDGINIVGNI